MRRDKTTLLKSTDSARLAHLHERIQTGERRLSQISNEVAALRDSMVGEDEMRAALAEFDALCAALSPPEQTRVIELLIEQVRYDGEQGTVAITFRPSGIRALESELRQEAAA